MTRDEIYDHLAQVYLGKSKKVEERKKNNFSVLFFVNVCITIIIFAGAFYGLTAFLTQKDSYFASSIIYSLHKGPIKIEYNFEDSFPPTKSFALTVPQINAGKYSNFSFSIRGKEEGVPGIVKIVFKNKRREEAVYYIKNINLSWQEFSIPLEQFEEITDWTSLTDISFVLESWNVEDKKGIVLLENIKFSS